MSAPRDARDEPARAPGRNGGGNGLLLPGFALLTAGAAVVRMWNGLLDDTTLLYLATGAAFVVLRDVRSFSFGPNFRLDMQQQLEDVKEATKGLEAAVAAGVGGKAPTPLGAGARRAGGGRRALPAPSPAAPMAGTVVPIASPAAAAPPSSTPAPASGTGTPPPAAPSPAAPDPDDPQRGRWGGLAVAGGRRLSAKVSPYPGGRDWYMIELEVVALEGSPPLKGPVVFHLHDTFVPAVQVVEPVRGRARLELTAWGAFTVGVECDDGRTRLELNLAELDDAPRAFRDG